MSASESNTHPEGQNVCSLDSQKLLTGAYKIILSVFCYTPIPPHTHTRSQPGQFSSSLLHVQPFHSTMTTVLLLLFLLHST